MNGKVAIIAWVMDRPLLSLPIYAIALLLGSFRVYLGGGMAWWWAFWVIQFCTVIVFLVVAPIISEIWWAWQRVKLERGIGGCGRAA